jgi:hypothetical protein
LLLSVKYLMHMSDVVVDELVLAAFLDHAPALFAE